MLMVWGRVSATTFAPRSAATVEASSWRTGAGIEGRYAEHVPVGRALGQQREPGHEVHLFLGEPVDAAGHDQLEGGAGVSASEAARASSSDREAEREGTGWPAPSLWVWA